MPCFSRITGRVISLSSCHHAVYWHKDDLECTKTGRNLEHAQNKSFVCYLFASRKHVCFKGINGHQPAWISSYLVAISNLAILQPCKTKPTCARISFFKVKAFTSTVDSKKCTILFATFLILCSLPRWELFFLPFYVDSWIKQLNK